MDLILKEQPQRTLTFIVDPGTQDEKTTEIVVASGVYVTYWVDEKGYEAFADRDGKTPWEDDYMTDQVIYLINPIKNGVAR